MRDYEGKIEELEAKKEELETRIEELDDEPWNGENDKCLKL
ncbi:10344_t:CDS:2, partial [Entrophospora sp. SA101]